MVGITLCTKKENEKMEQERKEEWLNIANTILSQIRAGDPVALMAWGMQHPKALPEFTDKESGMYYLGGVTFMVNGLKSGSASVTVRLSAQDHYDIVVVNTESALRGETFAKADGIYCDQLMEVIDRMIERGA